MTQKIITPKTLVLLALFALASCGKDKETLTIVEPIMRKEIAGSSFYLVEEELAYGDHARETLDIIEPLDRQNIIGQQFYFMGEPMFASIKTPFTPTLFTLPKWPICFPWGYV